ATIGIASGTAPFSGTYRIEVGTGNLLSAFDGASTQGTWTLKVSDKSTRDTGSLTAWSLVVNGTIGSGAGLSYAQGFLDEPTFAHESGGAFADHHFDAAPLVVTTSEPARPTGSAPFAVLGADRPALWLSSRGEGRAFVTQSEEGRSYAAARRASGSESGDHGGFDFDRERRGTAVAELYFPPEASDSDTGDFSGGALDAE
ncbi:MAG: proprotein convertase P-domain-containing protein, partial [Gemmata sp.]